MNRHARSLFLLLTAAGAAACGDSLGPIEGLPRDLSVAEGRLIDADNRFAFKLFREVNAWEADGNNVFLSPLSVSMALAMTTNGATGATREAMQQTLELDGMTLEEVNESYQSLIALLRGLDPRVEFVLANSVWYREGLPIVPEFLDRTQQFFDAEITALDFTAPGAADIINAWVSDQTRDRIDGIVDPPIDPLTIMFLINAIYFKGDWTFQFDTDLTENRDFALEDGSFTSVPMMAHGEEIPVRLHREEGYTVLDLAYGGRAYSMTIVVPDDPASIDELAETLTQPRWDSWIGSLDSASVHVSLPKFTLEYEITLNDVLQALGMEIALTPGAADFSDLIAGGGVYIDKVKHKTFVDVNEEGTEAAAVTSVEIQLTSAPTAVVVDQPFVFAVRENYSGAILFLGKIVDPGR